MRYLYIQKDRTIVNEYKIEINKLKYNVSGFNFVIFPENENEIVYNGRSVYTLQKTI